MTVTCLFVGWNICAWCRTSSVNFVKKCWCWDDFRQSDICVHHSYQIYKEMVVLSWWGVGNYQSHVFLIRSSKHMPMKRSSRWVSLVYLIQINLDFYIFVLRNFGRFGLEVALHSALLNVTILHYSKRVKLRWLFYPTQDALHEAQAGGNNLVGRRDKLGWMWAPCFFTSLRFIP